ncbi:MAG: hypothetical protein JW843_08610 [Candidatus Aminicenantes bacterium]|nr:hypothetical protein [Candidatus Aminicenantes bacterium]
MKPRLADALGRTHRLLVPETGPAVQATVAVEWAARLPGEVAVVRVPSSPARIPKGTVLVVSEDAALKKRLLKAGFPLPEGDDWACFDIDENGTGVLASGRPAFLFSAYSEIVENLLDRRLQGLCPRVWTMAFSREKSTFDLVLTQYARMIRPFDRERYVREYARLGFTHIEVNALAGPFPAETGVPDEFYPDFYTYCPALDQFVESRLNRGTYPAEYLRANLARLKGNARLALKYGLTPGLLCFEPRSLPEDFFRKYPTLRGPRVDHPFRSFKPRFSLSLVHPAARCHYAEMTAGLMAEVPELEFLSVWSNDSGSGFEHTKSLYVGRNGGPYLVREWKDDEEIARLAAENIAGFFRTLREAAAAVNPRFRVITRLESFYGERKHLRPLLGDGIDVEGNSLLTSGWENNYPHPEYPDIQVLGSALHNTLLPKDAAAARSLEKRGGRCFFYHFFSSHGNHEPLLGIPFPRLTYEKLAACARLKVKDLAHMGGLHPQDFVPYAVNQEVFRAFQLDSGRKIDDILSEIAGRWAGPAFAPDLVRGWSLMDTAVRTFVPMSLYSGFGSVWNRLLVRPLVPDIDRIPEEDRAYYERVMVTPPHNPNRVDLGKDVLFELISPAYARTARRRIDANVWKPLDKALDLFRRKAGDAEKAGNHEAARVFEDQAVRAEALRNHYTTLRNAAAWIEDVHGYLGARTVRDKSKFLKDLRDMIDSEIANAERMIGLWNNARSVWMMVSEIGETPFIHGENVPELLEKKIVLMKRHRLDKPFIDPDYMFRFAGDPYRSE